MKRKYPWWHSFNWRIALIRIAVNGLALLITAVLVPDIYFVTRTVGAVLLMALILGLLNAIVKPIVQILTSPLLFASYGLLVVVINALILKTAAWLFPGMFAVNGLLWALVGGMVIGLIASFMENLFGATPPIMMEGQPAETRRQARAPTNGQAPSSTSFAATSSGEPPNPETNPTTAEAEAPDETVHV